MPDNKKKAKLNPWDPVEPSSYNWDDLAGPTFAELRQQANTQDKKQPKPQK